MRQELTLSSTMWQTEPTCSIWTGSSVVEQMLAKGMVVSSSLTRSVGFPTDLADNTAILTHNSNKLINFVIDKNWKVIQNQQKYKRSEFG